MGYPLDPQRLNYYAANMDPFPLLSAINNSAGQGTNFMTMPAPGSTPADAPAGSFSTMLAPATQGQPPATPASPMNPQMLTMLMGAVNQPRLPAPAAVPPRPAQPINMGMPLPIQPPAQPRPFTSLMGGR